MLCWLMALMHVWSRMLCCCIVMLLLVQLSTSLVNSHASCRSGWMKKKLFGHKMIILGDSNFVFVMKEFILRFRSIATVSRVAHYHGCETYKHFNMGIDPSRIVWRSPKDMGIDAGPYTHGLREPFCPDCSTCDSEIYNLKHRDDSVNGVFRLEYFPILFGRDATIQSNKFNTTQEHLIAYLKSSGYDSDDYIMFNVGLHEMSHTSLHQYQRNLAFFSSLIATTGCKVIFVSTPHSNLPGLPRGFEAFYTVELTDQFNDVAIDVLSSNHNLIGTVDTSSFSLVGLEFGNYFKDGHHFLTNSSFYNAVMMQSLYVICSTTIGHSTQLRFKN